jgi:dimethylargininase
MSRPNTAVGRALVRPPGPRLADGIVTHIDRTPVDVGLAFEQWERYVDVLDAAGWTIIEVPGADECPDAVFVEDAVVVHRDVAIIAMPGADARKPEVLDVEKVVEAAGLEVAHIEAPGTLDGGDVLQVGDTIYVGRGGRTNAEGVRQLRALLRGRAVTVIAVPLSKVLHLKSAVTALPDGSIIGYLPLIDEPSLFAHLRSMPEEPGAHAVLLGGDRVLMASSGPKSADLVRELGYEPVLVDISEFEKLEGCVTCLSVRVR